ncbi:MAG TPA: class II glutamine amidotransferase [Streptosporangiaceae bacterium]|nr:class II glutamine amidotransferase [Streptosporangiaceae bacterium]
MCRLLGYCTRTDASLAELMGEQGLNEFTKMSEFHGDGWGVAWYDHQQPDDVHVKKSPVRASDSDAYNELTHRRLGDLGMVHLRWATPGLPVETRNTHPFRRGNMVMAHNGAIHPQDRLGELLPPAWERQLTGTTDSERYFLHVLSGLDAGEDVITAIEATVAHIDGLLQPNSLNAMLLTPGALYAICYYWPERIPHAALASRGMECGTDQYFELAHLETEAGIVVASSGWPQPGWTPLPNRNVLVIDRRTLEIDVVPLNPQSPAGPLRILENARPASHPSSRCRAPRQRVDAESRCSATVARCCSIARMPRRPCRRERASAPTIATASRIAIPAANTTASSASFRICMSIM